MTPRLWIYLIATIVTFGLLGWGIHSFNTMRAQAARVPELVQAVADGNATLVRERKAAIKTLEVSRGYQTDLSAVRAERDRLRNLPPRVVRVLVPAVAPAVGPRVAAAGRSGPAAATAVELATAPGQGSRLSRDIGSDLYGIVDDSDERESVLRAQVIRLQQAYAVAETTCKAGPP